jgi:hypothetical protein
MDRYTCVGEGREEGHAKRLNTSNKVRLAAPEMYGALPSLAAKPPYQPGEACSTRESRTSGTCITTREHLYIMPQPK